jgi:hypothetical protein
MKETERISEALSRVNAIVEGRDNIHVILASELKRKDRELLSGAGWLQEIIKGWYLLLRPDARPGDSSRW